MRSKIPSPRTLQIFTAALAMLPCLSVDESPWILPTLIVLSALFLLSLFSLLKKFLPKKLTTIFILFLIFILARQGQSALGLPVFWILSVLILLFSAGSVPDLSLAGLSWKEHMRTCYLFWIFSNGFILVGESVSLLIYGHVWSQPAATMALMGFWILVWDKWLQPIFEKQESLS